MLPLRGGIGSAQWQARKAFNFVGPLYDFRIRQNRLLFNPALPVSHTIAFEYFSSFFVATADATPVYQTYFVNDTDTCTLGDRLPTAYLRWAWKKEKGFDYAEDFAAYERLVGVASARDNRPQDVDMGNSQPALQPGIFVPYGTWNLP
jgi:hypothetical protein